MAVTAYRPLSGNCNALQFARLRAMTLVIKQQTLRYIRKATFKKIAFIAPRGCS